MKQTAEEKEALKILKEALKIKTIEAIQALSTHEHPAQASIGRALLAFYEPFLSYMDRERERGSTPCDVAYGLPQACGVLIATLMNMLNVTDEKMQQLCLLSVRSGIEKTLYPPPAERNSPNERT